MSITKGGATGTKIDGLQDKPKAWQMAGRRQWGLWYKKIGPAGGGDKTQKSSLTGRRAHKQRSKPGGLWSVVGEARNGWGRKKCVRVSAVPKAGPHRSGGL